jgi:hypothetical protein
VHITIQEDTDKKNSKKVVRPLTAEEKALKKKQDEVNATTRWLADSAFTTYFGKPAFHPYGKGNVNPTVSNQKFLTHNINGATGKTKTPFQQVYDSAYVAGVTKTQGIRIPAIPRQKNEVNSEQTQSSGVGLLPKTIKQQKEEAKKIVKSNQVSIKISKPRLTIDGFKVDEKDLSKKKTLERERQVQATK